MPKYGERSEKNLSGVHPTIQKVFRQVLLSGYDHSIICGVRSKEDQEKAYQEGNSEVNWPNSYHNLPPYKGEPVEKLRTSINWPYLRSKHSFAVDAMPYFSTKPHIDWGDLEAIAKFAGFVLGIASAMGIPHFGWGGDWNNNNRVKDERFKDMPHFMWKPWLRGEK